jgi:hypothetical protein
MLETSEVDAIFKANLQPIGEVEEDSHHYWQSPHAFVVTHSQPRGWPPHTSLLFREFKMFPTLPNWQAAYDGENLIANPKWVVYRSRGREYVDNPTPEFAQKLLGLFPRWPTVQEKAEKELAEIERLVRKDKNRGDPDFTIPPQVRTKIVGESLRWAKLSCSYSSQEVPPPVTWLPKGEENARTETLPSPSQVGPPESRWDSGAIVANSEKVPFQNGATGHRQADLRHKGRSEGMEPASFSPKQF